MTPQNVSLDPIPRNTSDWNTSMATDTSNSCIQPLFILERSLKGDPHLQRHQVLLKTANLLTCRGEQRVKIYASLIGFWIYIFITTKWFAKDEVLLSTFLLITRMLILMVNNNNVEAEEEEARSVHVPRTWSNVPIVSILKVLSRPTKILLSVSVQQRLQYRFHKQDN